VLPKSANVLVGKCWDSACSGERQAGQASTKHPGHPRRVTEIGPTMAPLDADERGAIETADLFRVSETSTVTWGHCRAGLSVNGCRRIRGCASRVLHQLSH
jgi:hypothetical protein